MDDLRRFNRALSAPLYTKEKIDSMESDPVSYFQNTIPSSWGADAGNALQPYLEGVNAALTPFPGWGADHGAEGGGSSCEHR